MPGAPWNGLFYEATLEFLVAVGGAVVFASTDDWFWRPFAGLVFVGALVLLIRTVRHAIALER